ncbi:MAG: uroporphyrinogen-III synthase [Bacteroidales bacterium]
MKIKNVLISQPEPTKEKSPYSELAEQYGLKIEFKQFIQIEGVTLKEYQTQGVDIRTHSAAVFTTKTGVDNFFRIIEEGKIAISDTMKYFCISESIALYLQKYIVYRKRKIFFGDGQFKSIVEIMAKAKNENFLLVLSDVYKEEITQILDQEKLKYSKGIFYKTVSANLSSIDIKTYDILAFFSPQGIKSLFYNFPDFQQNSTIIAAFGPTTAKAVQDAGLELSISVPTEEVRSMPQAIDLFIKQQKKKK